MAPHSSTLARKIPWMEEPGRLQSMGSWRVGYNWATSVSLSCIGAGNGNPLQCSCLENPRDGGASRAAVYGAAQSRARLKRLSSSSSSTIRERGKWVQWGEQQTWVPVGKTRRRQRVGDWQEVGRKASWGWAAPLWVSYALLLWAWLWCLHRWLHVSL